jgi:uridine monophosphate synthetase
MSALRELVLVLFDIGAFKFGEFTLKSGLKSPIYIDLRLIVSFPHVMQSVCDLMVEKTGHLSYDIVCGVPYTALPMATALSLKVNKPMLIKRKEGAKGYGTKKAIEGIYRKGQNCLIIEDLVTSGLSVFESIEPLEAEGLVVTDVIVLVDREQGGRRNIESKGKNLHALITVTDMLRILEQEQRIGSDIVTKVQAYVQANQTTVTHATPKAETPKYDIDRMTYLERAALCQNKAGAQLLKCMQDKKSNLCVSVDVTKKAEVLALVAAVGPYVCMVKTHCDIIEDFDLDMVRTRAPSLP